VERVRIHIFFDVFFFCINEDHTFYELKKSGFELSPTDQIESLLDHLFRMNHGKRVFHVSGAVNVSGGDLGLRYVQWWRHVQRNCMNFNGHVSVRHGSAV